MSRERSGLRDALEFVLARSLFEGLRHLPAEFLPLSSAALGGALARLLPRRKQVVRDNLRLAFGSSGPDPECLSRASFASLCRSFLELVTMSPRADVCRDTVRVRPTPENLRTLTLLRDGPAVLAASHFGAYEVCGSLAPLLGVPLTSLARPLDNRRLEAWLIGLRTRFGQRVSTNRGGLPDLFRELERGRSVAVLVDLNHKPANRLFVDFFGVPAATAPTAGLLARRAGVPLVTVYAHRSTVPLRFEIEFGEPIRSDPTLPREADVQRMMQHVTLELEARIRCDPTQWLWTHRRWKTQSEVVSESA